MSETSSNQNQNNNPNPATPRQGFRFPAFVKPGVLATRLVSASKSFFNTMGGSPVTGLESGSGLFGGYRPSTVNYANIPLSRFQSVSEFMGAYGSVSAVYTCVSTIANSIAGLPTDFVDQSGKTVATLGQKPAEDGSLAALLENPNPYQDWTALKETIVAHLELCGNALVLMDNMDGLGRPESLYPLNPAYIQLAVSPETGLLGYIYQPNGINKIYYSVDEVLHFKMANPQSIFWGQGTLQAIAGNLNTEIDILDSVNALYRNGAVIPGAFVAKETMTDSQFKMLKEQLMQEHTGSANFFKPLLLDGGLDWKSMSIGHTDLGTTDIRKLNREEIYMAFGVPVSQAGNQGHANVKNDHLTEVFWITTIDPKVRRLEQGLKKLTKRYDPRYSIKMPLPIKVAESEMLDNVIKVDGLTSLANSEKRTAIKAITGDRFGWNDIPDEMPIEEADLIQKQGAHTQPGQDAAQLPAPTALQEQGQTGQEPGQGPGPEELPLADAIKAANFTAEDVQNLVDKGIIEDSYLDLFDDTGAGDETGTGTGKAFGGGRGKGPGSRGGKFWVNAHGNVEYGPKPSGAGSSGSGGARATGHARTRTNTQARPQRAVRTGVGGGSGKPKYGELRPGYRIKPQTASQKLQAKKRMLSELDKVFRTGADPHGNKLDAKTLDQVSLLATQLRTELRGAGKALVEVLKALDFDLEEWGTAKTLTLAAPVETGADAFVETSTEEETGAVADENGESGQ